MGRNLQIPLELWDELCRFHLQYDQLEEWEIEELWQSIAHRIQLKQDAMNRREAYTQYKSGATPEDREAARQDYLDQRGVPGSYRWSQQYETERKK